MEKESKKEKKKFSKKYIAIILIIVIAIIALLGITSYNFMQEMILTNEVNELVENKDLTVDSIDVKDIKTTGEYAKVEEAIKTYLNDYAIETQKIIKIIGDEKISNLLTVENYEQDGPEFTETISYIDETAKQLNEASEKILKLMEKDEMFKYIENYEVDDKYKELYRTLMLNEETEKDLQEAQTELQNSINLLKNNLQIANNILDFLKQNKGNWDIENDMVMFNSQKLVDQYNELISKLKYDV